VVKGYHYGILIIELATKIKLQTSTSFQAINKIMIIFSQKIEIIHSPCNVTVSIWVKKIGYYLLQKPKEKANDWIIILDHSVQISSEKLLVVFGIRRSKINFKRPLNFTDLTIIKITSKKKWNGEIMQKILENLKSELGNIIYATGDYGSDLKKGLRLANISHVHDLTHKIALIVKYIYGDDQEFTELIQLISKLRQKWHLSQFAHLLPPKLRNKSRFQNIQTISSWGIKMLKYYDKNKNNPEKTEELEQIKAITKYKRLIIELSKLNEQIRKIEKLIKNKGLSRKTITQCQKYLTKLKGTNGIIFKNEMTNYFEDMLTLLPKEKKILATSDIIESAFGKYKNYLSSNYMTGITDLSLCIAAFTSKLTQQEIKEAMQSTRIQDLKDWSKENIGETFLQKRRKAFAV
jgi:hypothetical protein